MICKEHVAEVFASLTERIEALEKETVKKNYPVKDEQGITIRFAPLEATKKP